MGFSRLWYRWQQRIDSPRLFWSIVVWVELIGAYAMYAGYLQVRYGRWHLEVFRGLPPVEPEFGWIVQGWFFLGLGLVVFLVIGGGAYWRYLWDRRRRAKAGTWFASGGQTGVDRGVLDACLEKGWPCGGWCPAGRRAEDGPIDGRYPLQETEGRNDYEERTRRNVRDHGVTIIAVDGPAIEGGTALTLEMARELRKPHHLVELSTDPADAAKEILAGLREGCWETVNWAGPRESEAPGAYAWAKDVAGRVIDGLRNS